MARRSLVLDANILIRAVLGQRVRNILAAHADIVSFFVPETAYAEAEEHVGTLVAKRGGDPAKALVSLRAMAKLVAVVGEDLYREIRGRGAETARRARSGRLADSCSGPRARLRDLDRRHRLLRLWRRDLDLR